MCPSCHPGMRRFFKGQQEQGFKLLNAAKNTQLATSMLTSCNRLVINKPISGYVRMACNSFVDNKSVASCQQTCKLILNCQNFLFTGLLQVVLISCNKSGNGKLQQA